MFLWLQTQPASSFQRNMAHPQKPRTKLGRQSRAGQGPFLGMQQGMVWAALTTEFPGMLALQLGTQRETETSLWEGCWGASCQVQAGGENTLVCARGNKIRASPSIQLSQAAPVGSRINRLFNYGFISF